MVTLEEAAASLRMLTPPRLRNLANRLKPSDGLYGPGHLLYLWMAQLLGRTTALTSDQIDLILEKFGDTIQQYGGLVARELCNSMAKLTVASLVIPDNRYATVSGASLFVELNTGEDMLSLPRVPIFVMTYNMCEVYVQGLIALRRAHEGVEHAGRNKDSAG